MNLINTIWKIAYYAFTAAVLCIAAILVFSLIPMKGNVQVKIVSSGSMEPAIHTGSLAVILPQSMYAIDDIITFGEDTREKVPTTHRIVDMRVEAGQTLFQTKGDANEDPDVREVGEGEVIGKVLFSIPYLGYIIDFAKKPIGFFLLIVIPAGAIIVDEVWKIIKEVRKGRGKKEDGGGEIDSEGHADSVNDKL